MNRLWTIAPVLFSSLPAFGQILRPPAVPLIVHDPYFSVWSAADRLNDACPTHWTGKNHGFACLIRVDDHTYRLMGLEPQSCEPLPQESVRVTPTRTAYTFANADVRVTMTFMTPALPDNLDILARPVTYLTWEIAPLGGKDRRVTIYLDCTGDLAVNTPDQPVEWSREEVPGLTILRMGTVEQPILQKRGDDLRIDWGHVYLAVPTQAGPEMWFDLAAPARESFAKTGGRVPTLKEISPPRKPEDGSPIMAFRLDCGTVGEKGTVRHALLAYDDLWSIQYFDERLRPYWRRNGTDAKALLSAAEADYTRLVERCKIFDDEFTADLRRMGGDHYAALGALAYRQCLGANKLCADAAGRPLLFPKENFSNGCIATVDVIYPMAPLPLLLGFDLTRAMLVPVLDYGASPRWKFPFAPHDLGTYPHATGQVYGGGEQTEENQMPVEESANLIILVAAAARAEGSPDLAAQYWPTLTRWAEYLKAKGLDPENQLCTDDFTGHLARNVNLSCKAIVALAAYARLAEQRGLADVAKDYRQTAERFAQEWIKRADDGDHTRLAFDKPDTWSQKYNLVWDSVLDLKLFPAAVKAKELAYYRRIQKPFGLPLDNRATFTKIDWVHWTACLTGDRADFEALVEPMYRYVNETPDRVPISDWHETGNARKVGFVARPVIGGLFMRALCEPAVWSKWFGRGARGKGEWAPLPILVCDPIVPGAGDATHGAFEWRYTTKEPAAEWTKADFDDSGWQTGKGGFGTTETPGALIGTKWDTPDIWLRRVIELPAGDFSGARLHIHYDEDAEVYINGVRAAVLKGYATTYGTVDLTEEAKTALHPGRNVLAVHCHQTNGGQYIDVGLVTCRRYIPKP